MSKKGQAFTYRTLCNVSRIGLATVMVGIILLAAGNIYLRYGLGEALDRGNLSFALPIAAVLLFALTPPLSYLVQMLGIKIQKDLYRRIQSKVLHISMEKLKNEDMGAISAYYVTDVNQIDGFVNRMLTKAFPDLAAWLLTLGLLFWIDLFLGIGAVLATAVPLLFLHRMSRPIARGTEEYQAALEAANQSVATGLYQIETVKTSCKEDDFLRENQAKLAVLQQKKVKVALWEALLGAPMLVGAFGTILFLTALGGELVLLGRILPGQLLTAVTLTDNIVNFVMGLDGTIARYRRACVSMGRLDGFLGQEEEIGGDREVGRIEEIGFDRIYFAYPGGGRQEIYHGFSEQWRPGSPYFIKGGNGRGKSTLLKLLTGIYRVSGGRILVNRTPVEQYRLGSLREKIVVVSQENILFAGSIYDNLVCGKGVLKEQVEEACKQVGMHEEIGRMPLRYETMLRENGEPLSGGQKQRLCLARALLRKGDVYICDEPTSALDKANRERFIGLMERLAKDKIVVVVTHEKELLAKAQQIVEM